MGSRENPMHRPNQVQLEVPGILRRLLLLMTPFRHVRSGNCYRILVGARVSASTRPLQEGDIVVVYVDHLGNCHARLHEEFHDGRFERVEED